jgi:hypothetical protein
MANTIPALSPLSVAEDLFRSLATHLRTTYGGDWSFNAVRGVYDACIQVRHRPDGGEWRSVMVPTDSITSPHSIFEKVMDATKRLVPEQIHADLETADCWLTLIERETP